MTNRIVHRGLRDVALFGLLLLATASFAIAQAPLGTAFTYQGKLTDDNSEANAEYDLRFLLFDAAAGGSQVGSTVTHDDWPIVDGLFTVELDFTSAFDGNARWLEVQVRDGASGGSYTTLSPRQPLTAAPYAQYALNAPTASSHWEASGSAITNNNSGFVGVGRSNPVTSAEYFGVQAPVGAGAYGGMYLGTDSPTGRPFLGYNTGTERAWSYLDGATGDWHLYNDGVRLTVRDDGNVGIGTTSPIADFTVVTGQPDNAIRGETNGGTGVRGYGYNGLYGIASPTDGNGLVGVAHNGSSSYGVWGYSINGWAGTFSGKAQVTGNFYAGAKFFRIDHPVEPENKLLVHACVESDEMKNVYDGVVTLNGSGEEWVQLPDWFSSLNGNFRYQLTCIGEPALVYIKRKLADNRFLIAGGVSGMEVSWQVTGVRHDAYAKATPMQVEVEKEGAQRGLYVHPQAFGFDETMSLERDKLQAAESSQ